jgi:hypothetical protein
MTYDPAIPLASDIPSQSQHQIYDNFGQLNTQIGTEHTALNAATGNGKHKYITLIQNPVAPAPIGTDLLMKQVSAASTNDVEFLDVSGNRWYVPLRRLFITINIPVGSNTITLVNFATIALGNRISGTLHIYDDNSLSRSIFTTFVYIAPGLGVPGTIAGSWAGQLISGTKFTNFQTTGTVLQMKTTGIAVATTATLIITESRT